MGINSNYIKSITHSSYTSCSIGKTKYISSMNNIYMINTCFSNNTFKFTIIFFNFFLLSVITWSQKMLMTKNPAKKSPTFLLMTLNFNYIFLYLLISSIFSNSEKSGKIVSTNETDLSSVSKKNPASPDIFQCLRTEKPSKFKGCSHSVYSLELENLSNAIGLRKKQDTLKVA